MFGASGWNVLQRLHRVGEIADRRFVHRKAHRDGQR
jgi:hypothetical protein